MARPKIPEFFQILLKQIFRKSKRKQMFNSFNLFKIVNIKVQCYISLLDSRFSFNDQSLRT